VHTGGIRSLQSQLTFSRASRDLVDGGESIPVGCLTRQTSDLLVSAAFGKQSMVFQKLTLIGAPLSVLLIPPLAAGAVYTIPLKTPHLGVLGSGIITIQSVSTFLSYTSYSFVISTCLNVPASFWKCSLSGLVGMLLFNASMYLLSTGWMFPVPLGFLFFATTGTAGCLLTLLLLIFGSKIFTSMKLVKTILPLLGVPLLSIVFVVVFCFFRAAFEQCTPGQQAFLSPLWPLLKIVFKILAMKLVDLGKNPDAAPYMMFFFDLAGAMCGNWLFLSASGASSVLTMISVDVVENLSIALRVVYMVQTSRNDTNERLGRNNGKRLDRIERDGRESKRVNREALRKIRLENYKLRKRVSYLEASLLELEEGHARDDHDEFNSDEREVDGGRTKPDYGDYGDNGDGDVKKKAGTIQEPVQETEEEESWRVKMNQIGSEKLMIHRAVRLLLAFLASETSEIVSSGWCLIMIPIFYNSPNKGYFYTIDNFTYDDFKKAMSFSALDFALELITFTFMIIIFQFQCGIRVFHIGTNYVDAKKLLLPMISVGVLVTLVSFAFFLKHLGVDPLFKFDEYQSAGNNATELGMWG
jgi:hypothetical protein